MEREPLCKASNFMASPCLPVAQSHLGESPQLGSVALVYQVGYRTWQRGKPCPPRRRRIPLSQEQAAQ